MYILVTNTQLQNPEYVIIFIRIKKNNNMFKYLQTWASLNYIGVKN